jgi:hypothetical protein
MDDAGATTQPSREKVSRRQHSMATKKKAAKKAKKAAKKKH